MRRILLSLSLALIGMLLVTASVTGVPTTWTRQFGTTENESASGLDVDADGNVYVVGYTSGTLPGQTSASALGEGDVFVRKYDTSGIEVWTRQFDTPTGPTSSFDIANAVAIDSVGNVYVVGNVSGALPGQTNAGEEDVFLRKYDSSGNEVWTRQFGSGGTDDARGVTVFGTNAIYVVGSQALPGQTGLGGFDVFVSKYDGSGNEIWTRHFGTSSHDLGKGVGTDGSGNVYVVGTTPGTLPGQTSSGGRDAFVRKYDGQGNEVWTRQ